MIDRDAVLHVAKLARLRFSEEEVERLDLDGVEPTSHVVELQNVLREDVPRPGLSKEQALEQAPDPVDSGFRVPSPGQS
jgi:aspartyl-tRNA(Asn)/glutamyl-tRNA(Gln) amidotransferase subunit C